MFDDREGGVPQDPKNTKKKASRKRALLTGVILPQKKKRAISENQISLPFLKNP
jgi:hypothetical protein